MASDHSQTSTPLFRWRRRKRFGRRGGGGHGVGETGGGGGAYSDSECSPPTWRHYFTDANSNKMAQVGHYFVQNVNKRKKKMCLTKSRLIYTFFLHKLCPTITQHIKKKNISVHILPLLQSTGSEKRTGKSGSGRPSRQGQLRHTGSLTYGKDSQAAREHFLSSIRGGKHDVFSISNLPKIVDVLLFFS